MNDFLLSQQMCAVVHHASAFALSDRSSYLLRQLQQVFQEAAQFLVLNRSVIILSYKERIVINTTSSGGMFRGAIYARLVRRQKLCGSEKRKGKAKKSRRIKFQTRRLSKHTTPPPPARFMNKLELSFFLSAALAGRTRQVNRVLWESC